MVLVCWLMVCCWCKTYVNGIGFVIDVKPTMLMVGLFIKTYVLVLGLLM